MDEKIPNGWEIVKFGDVVGKVSDKFQDRSAWHFERYIGGEHFDEGAIRVTKSNPIKGNEDVIGSAFHMRFKPGHVLYVSRNPRLRKGGMVDFEGICSNTTYVLQADESKLLQSLLPFIIQTEAFVKHTTNSAHGSTNPFLNWKDIANYNLLLPPIEEQKKMAEILWSMEDNIEKNEKLIKKNKQYKKIMINQLLTKGIGHKKFKETELGRIPENWKLSKLSDIMNIIGGGTPKTSVTSYWNGNIPWISVEDFDSNSRYISSTKKTITKEGLDNSSTKILPKKSLIISARGTVGLVCQLNKEMAFNQSCYGLIGKGDVIDDFLYYSLLFNIEQLKHNAYGSTFNSITKNNFDIVDAAIPPIDEQKLIVEKLGLFEKVLSDYNKQLEKTNTLKKKLTNEFLSGKIRIPEGVLENVQ
ncbi:restriction endonuclease subunit S [Methanohalophilus mahii]|uniref:Restriction modification system DNA specificity domain protein n=1 Tax=Methanohalophilus mahii (strain ATCC 35705 / DSM 5219 / SLP) TaxID=547558 RepID=D5EBK8_METMS|nr:restriction endonuclease subunit S [Methanohalophilus mahii]ADE36559.1 restriction modification system DNA specificity domain protein [Methanohalophilus mahii DSM 5219]